MGYISSPSHFINYIKKIVKNNNINPDNLLEAETYISFVYQKGLQDQYSWDLKENPFLLEDDNLMQWLQKHNAIGNFLIPSNLEHIITAEFSTTLKDLKFIPGVYSFWTKSGIPLYIGVSIDLQSRVMSSFGERFLRYKKPVYFKYLSTGSASDAALLEVYFICKLKPSLNGVSKYSDLLTIQIKKEPKFSKPILCNKIKSVEKNEK